MRKPTQEQDPPRNELEVFRKSKQFNQLLLDNIQDLIAIHKIEDLSYKYVNPVTLQVLGYSQEELLAKSALELIHPDDMVKMLSNLQDLLPTGEGRNEFRYLKKDGSYVWLEVSGTIVHREIDEASLIMISRDITARKQAEMALQNANDELELKVQERTLQLKELTEQLQAKISDQYRAESQLKASEERFRILVETAPLGIAIHRKGRNLFVNQVYAAMHGYESSTELIGNLVSNLLAPECRRKIVNQIKRREKGEVLPSSYETIGLRKDGSVFPLFVQASNMMLLDGPANVAFLTDITVRTQTAQELEKSLEKMKRILMQEVSSLGTALMIRDPYTSGHQRRVVRLAAAIAEEMGCSMDQIEGITVAGNLHDIGKINIPSEILSKPGKLSDLEFAIVKTHSLAGYEIIKDIEFPWPVAEVIMQHHERMNGSGYPQGLAGEDILAEARIVAVADVVEAMFSHRPYRAALGMDRALEEIIRNRGILYDADVVDACLMLIQEKGFKLE